MQGLGFHKGETKFCRVKFRGLHGTCWRAFSTLLWGLAKVCLEVERVGIGLSRFLCEGC